MAHPVSSLKKMMDAKFFVIDFLIRIIVVKKNVIAIEIINRYNSVDSAILDKVRILATNVIRRTTVKPRRIKIEFRIRILFLRVFFLFSIVMLI